MYAKQKVFDFLDKIQLIRRKSIAKKQAKRLQNRDFTLISNNCNGGVLLKELGVRFNSQFVNLSISAKDYVEYLQDFDHYNNMELSFLEDTSVPYPIGVLGNLRINFVHFKSREEAKLKWDERKKRINKENMFIIFTDQEECTEEQIRMFDKLPYGNKIVFTRKEYNDIKSAVFVKKYSDNPKGVYMFLGFKNIFSSQRNYDVFDFVSWFNGERNLSKLMKE